MRQICLDTETTGLSPKQGHKVIEIGCVELENRVLTGNTFHAYINPLRVVDEGAVRVHGITNEFLEDKPRFCQVADEFLKFIKGAELIIHNAPFDLGFLDMELANTHPQLGPLIELHPVIDTVLLSRKLFPGKPANLDALCRRLEVDNSARTYHGALLDSEILAEVYLMMTQGQTSFNLSDSRKISASQQTIFKIKRPETKLKVIYAETE